jgi:hypothetical protein
MISLNDSQLKTVMAAASHVPHEKRGQFLERIAAMLVLRGRGHTSTMTMSCALQPLRSPVSPISRRRDVRFVPPAD